MSENITSQIKAKGNGENEEVLRAESLYHIYESKARDGNVVALRGLSFIINYGEAVAVVGPSGSGKSTLLKTLGGLMTPTAGMVSLQGHPLHRLEGTKLVKVRRETVSFIFQEGNLLPHLSGLDNVMHPLRHQHIPYRKAKVQAIELLERLGMAHRMNALPEHLSGGEQQRIAVARALITKPKLILADEPTGALDPHTTQVVMEIFTELHRELNTAFLVVTHSRTVAGFADRLLELTDGHFTAQHGEGVNLHDLDPTREVIMDRRGNLQLPEGVAKQLGGSGLLLASGDCKGKITLENPSILADSEGGGAGCGGGEGKRKMVPAPACPACGHNYAADNKVLSCPVCGSERPVNNE